MTTKGKPRPAQRPSAGRPSALIDTRVIYCGDCLDHPSEPRPSGSGRQPAPDACTDLIYIDPPFNSNRNYEVFWGDLSEPRPSGSRFPPPFEDRHASTAAYIDYMRPRCVGGDPGAVPGVGASTSSLTSPSTRASVRR